MAKELIPNLRQTGRTWVGTIRDEKTPALTIYPDTQSWTHFAGDTTPRGKNGGDVIDLIEYINKCFPREAIAFLAQRSGLEMPHLTPEEQERVTEERKRTDEDSAILERLVQIFEQNRDKAIHYLQGRGINNEPIEKYRIGWANHSLGTLRNELRDFNAELVSIILSSTSFYINSLIIPIIEHGRIVALYSRSNDRQGNHLYLKGHEKGIFNHDEALITAEKQIYVAEALIDALSAIQHGIKNIVAFGGCEPSEEQKTWLRKLRDIEIITCFDNDSPGYNATKAFMKDFPGAKMKVLPPGDLNDFFREHSREDFEKLETKDWFTVLLQEVNINTPKESILSALKPLLEELAVGKSLGEAEIFIRNRVASELNIKTQDILSIIKDFKKMRVGIVAKMEAETKTSEQLNAEPPLTEQEIQAAEDILKSPTLLYDILMMVKKLGVVGEERNILLHYIILTSRKLKQPLSATVKGDSSAGKSYTLLTTIKMFPKSAYIDLTDATPQSFYYCPEDHFKHKIIVIFEKHGGERADYAIRTLQSEGKLKIQVTVKNPETGQFEAQTIEKDGPTGFVTTTTASFIHAENDTRNISMFPDQSSEQTTRVYESVDSRYLGTQPISDNELKPWHHAQLSLEQLPVYIPFVKSFRKYFPKHIIRTRRDYGHFLAIVETSALLHQKQREKIELHGQTHIRATLADAYIAKVIVEGSLSKSIYELPEKTIEVIKKATELVDKLQKASPDKSPEDITFTITGLAKSLEWDRDTVAKWMKPAGKKGYLTIVEESRGPKGAEYKVEEKELPGDSFLPTVEQLAIDNPEEKTDGIYDPLTGEPKIVSINPDVLCTDAPIELEEGKNKLSGDLDFRDTSFEEGFNSIGASVENKQP